MRVIRRTALLLVAAAVALLATVTSTSLPAASAARVASPMTATATRCTVTAQSLTIKSQPDGYGAPVGTLYNGDYFDVTNFRDNVWVLGSGYRRSGAFVASGYVLRNYLSC